MVSVVWAWSSPSFPRSGVAGEAAEVVCRALVFDLVSPAGRGGEGRRRSGWVFRLVVVLLGCCVGASLAGRGGVGRAPSEELGDRVDGVAGGLAVARGSFGGRESEDFSVVVVALRGCRAGGDVHGLAFWSSGSVFVTARVAPPSSWSLEVLLCRWSSARSARGGSAPLFSGGQDGGATEVVKWWVVEGSGRAWPDRVRFELGVCRRPMIVKISIDPIRWNWWILRLVKAVWLGALPSPGFVVDGGFFAGVRAGGGPGRWREVEEEVDPLFFHLLYPFHVLLYSYAYVRCILTTFC